MSYFWIPDVGSSWKGPFHDFVKDAWWQKVLVYEQHELKLMWSHVQFAWWWYLELRRDRDLICIMRYEPNLVLGWIVVELTSIQSIEEYLWISIGTTTIFEKGGGLVPVEIQRSSSMDWMDISSTSIHSRTRLGSYLIIQMTSLSLLNSRYHHHANWTWVHMSLSSCCS